MEKPRVLFIGTPQFAIPALALLLKQHYPVVGVITPPDRPQGRKLVMSPSPVKVFAREHDLSLQQPERLDDEAFLQVFRQWAPDLVVLAAYGKLLPREFIDRPPLACLNIHPSLLPKYRGAAPINWAIINGEEVTGVTIMSMSAELDAGDIILQEEIAIGADETYGRLHDRLAHRGAEMLIQAIEMKMNKTARSLPQEETAATYAPRLQKEDGLIRWARRGTTIVNLIRGLSPSPGAYTFMDGKMLKVLAARAEVQNTEGLPVGTAITAGKSLKVAVADGWVMLLDIQMENKRRMAVADFLRGCRVNSGTVLGDRK